MDRFLLVATVRECNCRVDATGCYLGGQLKTNSYKNEIGFPRYFYDYAGGAPSSSPFIIFS